MIFFLDYLGISQFERLKDNIKKLLIITLLRFITIGLKILRVSMVLTVIMF